MLKRGYKVDSNWWNPFYRGKKLGEDFSIEPIEGETGIYPEHDDKYLQECLDNLRRKGIEIKL